jgi:hypothetical protein
MAIPIPNVSASSSAASRAEQVGNAWAIGGGDWIINQSGSGVSAQSAGFALQPWMIALAIAGVAWYVLK